MAFGRNYILVEYNLKQLRCESKGQETPSLSSTKPTPLYTQTSQTQVSSFPSPTDPSIASWCERMLQESTPLLKRLTLLGNFSVLYGERDQQRHQVSWSHYDHTKRPADSLVLQIIPLSGPCQVRSVRS